VGRAFRFFAADETGTKNGSSDCEIALAIVLETMVETGCSLLVQSAAISARREYCSNDDRKGAFPIPATAKRTGWRDFWKCVHDREQQKLTRMTPLVHSFAGSNHR